MTEKRIRVGIDIDGVIYQFDRAFKKYLVREHNWNEDLCGTPQRWGFYLDWGLTHEGFKMVCDQAANMNQLWQAEECTDFYAISQIRRLHDHPLVDVYIITSRDFGWHPGVSHTATAQWLREHDVRYKTLVFSQDKTVIRTDFMIEDNADNYCHLRAVGTQAFLLDRPWNQHHDIKPKFGITPDPKHRVRSVKEFVDTVLASIDTHKEVPF